MRNYKENLKKIKARVGYSKMPVENWYCMDRLNNIVVPWACYG